MYSNRLDRMEQTFASWKSEFYELEAKSLENKRERENEKHEAQKPIDRSFRLTVAFTFIAGKNHPSSSNCENYKQRAHTTKNKFSFAYLFAHQSPVASRRLLERPIGGRMIFQALDLLLPPFFDFHPIFCEQEAIMNSNGKKKFSLPSLYSKQTIF